MDNLGSPEPAPVIGHWKECLQSLHLKSTNKSEVFTSPTVSISITCNVTKNMNHVEKRRVGEKQLQVASVSYWVISDKKLLRMVTVREKNLSPKLSFSLHQIQPTQAVYRLNKIPRASSYLRSCCSHVPLRPRTKPQFPCKGVNLFIATDVANNVASFPV